MPMFGSVVPYCLTIRRGRSKNPLFVKRLGLILVAVVHQLQIHVHKQRVEDLWQLSSVAVQNWLDEPLQTAVVYLIQRRVALLAVRRENHIDIRLVLAGSCGQRKNISLQYIQFSDCLLYGRLEFTVETERYEALFKSSKNQKVLNMLSYMIIEIFSKIS